METGAPGVTGACAWVPPAAEITITPAVAHAANPSAVVKTAKGRLWTCNRAATNLVRH